MALRSFCGITKRGISGTSLSKAEEEQVKLAKLCSLELQKRIASVKLVDKKLTDSLESEDPEKIASAIQETKKALEAATSPLPPFDVEN